MTTLTDENLTDDSFFTADEPGQDGTTSGPVPAADDAPYGWTTDKKTGERRPKLRPGRPKLPLTAEELAASEPVARTEDRAPGPAPKGRRPGPRADQPMPRSGMIADGVNKLYRRAGRLIRAMDHDIGTAIIECTRPGEDGEPTVGEAWEQLARTNPRIRRFILNALSGGAWSDLLMAHAPIGIALFMKPSVQRFISFGRLVESAAEPDEDTPEGEGNLPGGMTADDANQMRDLAEQMASQAAARFGVQLTPEDMAQAQAAAEAMMGGNGPVSVRRQQPRQRTRAQRKGR